MKQILPLLLVATILAACAAPASKLNRLSVGMQKTDVLKVLGEPQSVSAQDGVEYMLYTLGEGMTLGSDPYGRGKIDQAKSLYFVRIKAGVVDSYGRVGDFDSTKVPETKQTIEIKGETKHTIDINAK